MEALGGGTASQQHRAVWPAQTAQGACSALLARHAPCVKRLLGEDAWNLWPSSALRCACATLHAAHGLGPWGLQSWLRPSAHHGPGAACAARGPAYASAVSAQHRCVSLRPAVWGRPSASSNKHAAAVWQESPGRAHLWHWCPSTILTCTRPHHAEGVKRAVRDQRRGPASRHGRNCCLLPGSVHAQFARTRPLSQLACRCW